MRPTIIGCYDDFPNRLTSQILSIFQGTIFLACEIIKQELQSEHSSIIAGYFLNRSVVGMLWMKLLCQLGSELNENCISSKVDCK